MANKIKKEGNCIIWSPTAKNPPTRRFAEKAALVVAEKLSAENPHEEFYAAKIISKSKTTQAHGGFFKWTKTDEVK